MRRYRVRAHGHVTQGELDKLRDGITVDGIHYGQIDATLERDQGANIWLSFAIREGKNREVRNVLTHLGLQVNRLGEAKLRAESHARSPAAGRQVPDDGCRTLRRSPPEATPSRARLSAMGLSRPLVGTA